MKVTTITSDQFIQGNYMNEFTEQELLYLHNCTSSHKFVVRARDPYPDSLDEIYYSVRKKLTDLIDNNSAL